LANKLRIAIVGFGPFGSEVAKLLFGEVDDICILAKEGSHLEQFTKDDRYVEKVLKLQEPIDTESVDSALVELGIVPQDIESGASGESEAKTAKTVEVAIVDMFSQLPGEDFRSHVIKKLSDHAEKVVAPAYTSAEVDDLKKDGADQVVPVYREAALRTVHSLLNPKTQDIDKVSNSLYEANIDLIQDLTGKTVGDITREFGVGVVLVITSIPVTKGRRKKIVAYKEKELRFPPDSYAIAENDTAIRVIGTIDQIRKFEDTIE